MAGTPRNIRKVRPAKVADGDVELWPIVCAILILAGFVSAMVISGSSFDDPRLLYNGWARLASVAVMVGLALLGVARLKGRNRRRLLLCVLVSLLAHGALIWRLHQEYLTAHSLEEARARQNVADPRELDVAPEFHWQQPDQPATPQSFEEPVETEQPKVLDTEPLRRQELEHRMPVEERPPTDPEPPQTQQPNPLEMQRAQLTAPRRAEEAAGGQVSRQDAKQRPQIGEPIPQPEVRTAPAESLGTLAARVPAVQRQRPSGTTPERRAADEPQSPQRQQPMALARQATQLGPNTEPPATPIPSRQLAQAAEVPRTEATAPQPVQAAEPLRPAALMPGPVAARRRPTEVPRSPQQTVTPMPATPSAEPSRPAAPQRRAEQPTAPEMAQASPALSRLPRPANLGAEAAEPAGAGWGGSSTATPTEAALAAAPLRAAAAPIGRQRAALQPPGSAPAVAAETAPAGTPPPLARAEPRRASPHTSLSPTADASGSSIASRRPVAAPDVSAATSEAPAPPRTGPSGEPNLAATQPGTTAVAKAAVSPARTSVQPSEPGLALAAISRAAQLPASVARRAVASQQQPGGVGPGPSVPSTLARAERGANLPSTALPTEAEGALSPAAIGGSAGGQIEATSATAAVERSAAAAPTGGNTAAAGTAEFAVGAGQIVARIGQPRALGLGDASAAVTSPVARISRAASGNAVSIAPLDPSWGGSSTATPTEPAIAAAAEAGGPPSPSRDARGAAAARRGRAAMPATQPVLGSGPAGPSGTADRIPVAGLAPVTRHEAVASGLISGGGTSQPSRTSAGRALMIDAQADAPAAAMAPPGAGKTPGTPLQAQVAAQGRKLAGLPGSLQSIAASGAPTSFTVDGAPLPQAVGRRATASQTRDGGPGWQPEISATIARSKTAGEWPAAAVPVEPIVTPGAGGVGLSQGALPSGLQAGSTATVQRSAGRAPIGPATVSAGVAEFAVGTAPVAALPGRVHTGGQVVPTAATDAAPVQVGRTPASAMGDVVAAVAIGPAEDSRASAAVAIEGTGGSVEAAAVAVGRTAGPRELPGPGGVPGGGPDDGMAGATVTPARLGRSQQPDAAVAVAQAGGAPGPERQAGREPTADVLADLAVASVPAITPGAPAGSGWGGSSTATPTEVAAVGPQRRGAGLPGSLNDRVAVEGATVAGPNATTPAVSAGPRRLPQGIDPGLPLAASVGSGPLGKRNTAGLPGGIDETVDQQPAMAAVAPQPGTAGDLTAGAGVGEVSRQEGGLPVQIPAVPGPGGLGLSPSLNVGVPSRFARPESEIVHTISRRFVIERSGGALAIDGSVREPTEAFRHREPGRRSQAARARGGSDATSRTVEIGLDFFARVQFPDGHWSLHKLPEGVKLDDSALGQIEADTAATGLALLTYLGAGYTHLDDKHRAVVRRGVDWLVHNQKPNGDLFTGGSQYAWFYSHGIAAIALCEAYGMTQDPELREPARKAVEFIVNTQHATRGGWRYTVQPATGRSTETDTSVTGWQLMALKSAQMAGLTVPAESLEKIGRWLDTAEARRQRGLYVYNPHADASKPEQRDGLKPSLAMTAEAMLMRMYLGARREDPKLIEGSEYLRANLPAFGTAEHPARDCYYWYYATQAMFQMQGDCWIDWDERMQALLKASQVERGELAGSWHPLQPAADRWGQAGGRLYVTALHLLMLEVYYRHLPLFQELSK